MSDILDVPGLRARVIMPASAFDEMYAADAVFIESQLEIGTSEIYGRLRKRYTVPLTGPVPEVVRGWLAAIVTPELYLRRGWDPDSPEAQAVLATAERARVAMREAADSKDGLWDLPLREDAAGSGITAGGPLGYSELDPYEWQRVQAEALRGR